MTRSPEPLFTQEFQLFERAHANRSSDVYLSADNRAVLKTRSEQSEEKFMREFLSLLVWDRMLGHYNQDAGETGTIASPKPLAVNLEDKSLYMSFLPGETINTAYSMTRSAMGGLAVRDLITYSAYRLGRLFSIKEHERLVHGDFDPRHLLVGKTAVLSVIDVESTYLGLPADVSTEHRKLHDKVTGGVPGWKSRAFADGFQQGRTDFRVGRDRVVDDIVASVNLGEKPDFNVALLSSKSRSGT